MYAGRQHIPLPCYIIQACLLWMRPWRGSVKMGNVWYLPEVQCFVGNISTVPHMGRPPTDHLSDVISCQESAELYELGTLYPYCGVHFPSSTTTAASWEGFVGCWGEGVIQSDAGTTLVGIWLSSLGLSAMTHPSGGLRLLNHVQHSTLGMYTFTVIKYFTVCVSECV